MSANLERLESILFGDSTSLSPKETELKIRHMDVYTQMLHNPAISNKKLCEYLQATYDVSQAVAYSIIAGTKSLMGNVKDTIKEFHRYTAIEMIKQAYDIASNAESNSDDLYRAEIMIKAAKALGFVTRLDKEDAEQPRWSEIIPQNFEITNDVTVLGLRKIPDLEARKAKLRKELFGKITAQEEEYVEFED